jgi:hypothetical protein
VDVDLALSDALDARPGSDPTEGLTLLTLSIPPDAPTPPAAALGTSDVEKSQLALSDGQSATTLASSDPGPPAGKAGAVSVPQAGATVPGAAIPPDAGAKVPFRPAEPLRPGSSERQDRSRELGGNSTTTPVMAARMAMAAETANHPTLQGGSDTFGDMTSMLADPLLGAAGDVPSDTGLLSAPGDVRRSGTEGFPTHRGLPSTPLQPERQIVAAIATTESGRTDILLDPQDLGRVVLSLEGDDTALVLTIQAERSDTADLLRRNADLLLEEFRQAGYQNLSFSFSEQGKAPEQGFAAETGGTPAPEPAGAGPALDSGPRSTGTSTLDLRL